MNSIIWNLIEGEVSGTEEDLAAVSQDFVIQNSLRLLFVLNSTDVAKAVKYTADKELTISSRAAGHSLVVNLWTKAESS